MEFNGELIQATQTWKCLECVALYMLAKNDIAGGILHDDADPVLPPINDAITLAPSWQTTMMAGQMVVACVPLPSCLEHLSATPQSPIERATRSGLMLGGQAPQ